MCYAHSNLLSGGVSNKIQSKYPRIHYSVFSGDAVHITERLDKGLVDFGLLVEPVDLTKYDYIELPVRDIWGVIMPSDCALAAKEKIEPQDLYDKPLILSRQTERDSAMEK